MGDRVFRLVNIILFIVGMISDLTFAVELVSNGHTEPANHQMSVGTSMVIIFGIAIGIGVIVFLIGFISFKRCRGVKARQGGPHMTLHSSGYPVELELDESRRGEKCKQNFAELVQQQHQQPTPAPQVGYHSLKLGGNEYTHIWETPVPTQTSGKDFLDDGEEDSPSKDRRLSQPELIFMRHAAACEHVIGDARIVAPGQGDLTLPRANRKYPGQAPLHPASASAQDELSYDPPRYFLVNREVWASNVPPYPDTGEPGMLADMEPDVHSHIHPTQPIPHTHTTHTHHAPHCTAHAAELAAAAVLEVNARKQQLESCSSPGGGVNKKC